MLINCCFFWGPRRACYLLISQYQLLFLSLFGLLLWERPEVPIMRRTRVYKFLYYYIFYSRIYKDIKEYIKYYSIYKVAKSSRGLLIDYSEQIPILNLYLSIIYIDFIISLLLLTRRNNTIINITNAFLKWI
jgi:hypothetical protein